jgi:DNA-3-methyladenine glycosylase
MTTRLGRDFYARDTIRVAQELIGKKLIRLLPSGARLAGRIVETEAYLGIEDPACHSYSGRRTARTEVMFGLPGLSYIYFIYGAHFCFNVVTAARDVPEAVLVRAVEPLEGIEDMKAARPRSPVEHLTNGPGKLCRSLRLGRDENGLDLTVSERLWLEEDVTVHSNDIVEGPRIGLGDRHDAVYWPLRFGFRGSAALSPPKFPEDTR